MDPTPVEELQKALATRLARYQVSKAVVAAVAKRVARPGFKVARFDFCPYGICIDYLWDKRILVDKLVTSERFRAVKYFPYGTPVDDFGHLHVEMHVPELNEVAGPG
jgi:hypothetical protein